MVDAMSRIAEQKIKEAMERGEFDNLAGRGQPQDLEDYSRLPDDVRMAYHILKNAGCVPPEVMIKNEILQIEDLLATEKDEQERYRQLKKLNLLVMKLNTLRRKAVNMEEQERYLPQLAARISVKTGKDPHGGSK